MIHDLKPAIVTRRSTGACKPAPRLPPEGAHSPSARRASPFGSRWRDAQVAADLSRQFVTDIRVPGTADRRLFAGLPHQECLRHRERGRGHGFSSGRADPAASRLNVDLFVLAGHGRQRISPVHFQGLTERRGKILD
jgi:hypothetical protein